MGYGKRLAILTILDTFIVCISVAASTILLEGNFQHNPSTLILVTSASMILFHFPYALINRFYHRAWEYASIGELKAIIKTVTFSVFSTCIVQLLIFKDIFPNLLILLWMLLVILLGGSRFVWRMYRETFLKPKTKRRRTIIVGAGRAGTMVARQLMNDRETDILPIGFVDDDLNKKNLDIFGISVLGTIKDIEAVAKKHKAEMILIAIPSLHKKQLNQIVEECAKTKLKLQIIPKIEDVLVGKLSVTSFRDVEVEDLLGRDPVELDIKGISEKLEGKTILVTGAGGSIGSEICRQVAQFRPRKLLLLGHGENSIYQIDMEMRKKYEGQMEITPIIADIQDRKRIFEVMEEYRPEVVYHAAAHKHVPLMEYNPKEAVKNNIFGTKHVAEAAGTFGAETFVLISSDKAVNPTNVMGASKRCAELVIQEMNNQFETKYVAVRFGNVLGSRGSVIPLFKKQIQEGGPVTVTHPEMKRYFMTIPEASRLVIQAGALARGGEIFVLDMGEPVLIKTLAENLIKLSGYTVEEIGIVYTGIRPGEKMFEELLNENEVHPKQIFPKIHLGKASLIGEDMLVKFLEEYESLNNEEIKKRLIEIANLKLKNQKNIQKATIN